MPEVQLGSPLPLAAAVAALVGAGFVVAVQRYRRGRNPRRYDSRLAWLRAGAYFSFAWALGLLTGAASTIVDNPLVFPGQTSDVWWWVFTVAALAVVFVGYWVIWPIGTRAHGRHVVMPDTPVFGLLWGVSEGMIFASVWTVAVRIFGRSDTWERLAVFATCYVVLSLFIGLWHAVYWDIYIAPWHNVLEWNIRKVILCHNPNVIVTTAYVTVFGNLGIYVGLQAFALFGATLAMPFPSFREPNPAIDPDAPPGRDLAGMVCVVTGVGSHTIDDVTTDLAELGATVLLVSEDVRTAEILRDRTRRWTGNPHVAIARVDLTSQDGVRRLVQHVRERWGAADVLVDDWGDVDAATDIGGLVARHRGGVLLQQELGRLATAERPLRVVVAGSEDHRRAESAALARLSNGGGSSPDLPTVTAARIVAARALAVRVDADAVQVHTAAPGAMVGNASADGGGASTFFQTIFQSNEDPALTYVHLARGVDLDPPTGGYWTNSAPVEPAEAVTDDAVAAAVWEWSVRPS